MGGEKPVKLSFALYPKSSFVKVIGFWYLVLSFESKNEKLITKNSF
jgi:hypothetical protein